MLHKVKEDGESYGRGKKGKERGFTPKEVKVELRWSWATPGNIHAKPGSVH